MASFASWFAMPTQAGTPERLVWEAHPEGVAKTQMLLGKSPTHGCHAFLWVAPYQGSGNPDRAIFHPEKPDGLPSAGT